MKKKKGFLVWTAGGHARVFFFFNPRDGVLPVVNELVTKERASGLILLLLRPVGSSNESSLTLVLSVGGKVCRVEGEKGCNYLLNNPVPGLGWGGEGLGSTYKVVPHLRPTLELRHLTHLLQEDEAKSVFETPISSFPLPSSSSSLHSLGRCSSDHRTRLWTLTPLKKKIPDSSGLRIHPASGRWRDVADLCQASHSILFQHFFFFFRFFPADGKQKAREERAERAPAVAETAIPLCLSLGTARCRSPAVGGQRWFVTCRPQQERRKQNKQNITKQNKMEDKVSIGQESAVGLVGGTTVDFSHLSGSWKLSLALAPANLPRQQPVWYDLWSIHCERGVLIRQGTNSCSISCEITIGERQKDHIHIHTYLRTVEADLYARYEQVQPLSYTYIRKAPIDKSTMNPICKARTYQSKTARLFFPKATGSIARHKPPPPSTRRRGRDTPTGQAAVSLDVAPV
ncbi:hypothetical protein L249_2937 [Ophiocordyceps polyrhachis-furcata BCC 54312]|uniref:Uncharacterized protein n=1 Tax=Ophiocordyceps polyrhachis-furcata BCC 54312 TaxID=1330021 RepID=A0A367LT10_9HYPO|nr:hypothetical protein L249_2937 [Ophiocordyceps polyrhachis-furcata BCC 54312]